MADYTSSIFILLADDDAGDCILFKDAIDQLKQNVSLEVCNNGFTLMKYLSNPKNHLPDFIFLDLNMPLKNGIECLQEIKKSAKWKHIKTVILSTTCNPDQKTELYNLGADLCLQKPNSFSTFKNILSKCLQMDWATLK